jgi:hypothetical protein
MVEAVPALLVVQRHRKEARGHALVQQALSVAGLHVARDRPTEWRTETVQDGDPSQEALQLWCLARQYLFEQIRVHELPLASHHGRRAGLGGAGWRADKAEQAKSDGPTLRSIDRIGDKSVVNRRVAHPPDECDCLSSIEAQVVGTNLNDLTASA